MIDTASGYRSRIKMLNAINELPAVITDVGFNAAFYKLLVDNQRLINLKPYIDQDANWKNNLSEEILADCTEKNGAIYMSPLSTVCYSYSGIFWNKDLFKEAGIFTFPTTWKGLWDVSEKLTKAGITPFSLHTAGTAWSPMLFATAYIGQDKSGLSFMQQTLPKNYNNDNTRDMVKTLKRLFEYTTPDAIDGDFDVASNHFIQKETAMIGNGYWMIQQFDEEDKANIGFAPFPGNIMVASPQMSAWAVTADHSQEVQQGAIEFLKYRSKINQRESVDFLAGKTSQGKTLELEYIKAANEIEVMVPNYQLNWNPILQDEIFTTKIPELVNEKISVKEFIGFMNESVQRYEAEN